MKCTKLDKSSGDKKTLNGTNYRVFETKKWEKAFCQVMTFSFHQKPMKVVKNPVFSLSDQQLVTSLTKDADEAGCLMIKRKSKESLLSNSFNDSLLSSNSPYLRSDIDPPERVKVLPPLKNAPPVKAQHIPESHVVRKTEPKPRKKNKSNQENKPVSQPKNAKVSVRSRDSTQNALLSHKNEPIAGSPTKTQPLTVVKQPVTTNHKIMPLSPKVQKKSPISQKTVTKNTQEPTKPASKPSHEPAAADGYYETEEDFCFAVCEARITKEFKDLEKFFERIYSSTTELIKIFKVSNQKENRLNIDLNYLDYLHESIIRMPKEVQKIILRSTINCMMAETKKERSGDDLRALLILLLNPLFTDASTFVIFAHVLRQLGKMQTSEHCIMIEFLQKLPVKEYKSIVDKVSAFISYRLFPSNNEVMESEMSSWWVPNAAKVLALLNAANERSAPLIIPHSEFYVRGLELLDLVKEYQTWQGGSQSFSFCQYPFLLSLSSKRFIMQKDSETKMLMEARQSLAKKVRKKEQPNMGMLFLNLNIRRKFILEDSLAEISLKHANLKKKLRVIFTGEPGIDLGGVSKEWFFLIMQRFFNEDYGMFKYNSKTKLWWFNSSSKDNYQEFNLCGVLLGLAVYNGINLNVHFPPCLYKKLLSPAIVPFNNPHASVGVTRMGMPEFKQVYPELANGLSELLNYDGNVEEDLCQSFQVSFTEFGEVLTRNLKPQGELIPVTKENREEYVNLYVDYFMNKCIYQQFYSFYHGFHSVCASNALLLLRPDEVETLVIGEPDFNIKDLEKVTKYDGYRRSDPIVRNLWDVLYSMPNHSQRKFLFFCTGSDRIPVGGVKEIKFKVTKVAGQHATKMLPIAHTCFNQLCLPSYKTRKILCKKLTIAIENGEGFGLE